jgi:hypothetical protein
MPQFNQHALEVKTMIKPEARSEFFTFLIIVFTQLNAG